MMSVIGANIKKYRTQKGITQEQLGQMIGVTTQAVSKWERGGTPDAELLPRISDLLEVSIDALFGREEQSIAAALMRQLSDLTEEEAFQFAFDICWALELGLFHEKKTDDFLHVFMDRSAAAIDKIGYFCKMVADGGIAKTRLSPGFNLFFLMTEPESGLKAQLSDPEALRGIFRVLADKKLLTIICYLYTRLNTPIATSLISQNTGLSQQEVDRCMDILCDNDLAVKTVIATSNGEMYSYMYNHESSVIPLLCFADEIVQKDARDFLLDFSRTKPLL